MDNEDALVQHVKNYRNKTVDAIDGKIAGLFLDKPLDDFTAEERGFESGLCAARRAVQSFMIIPRSQRGMDE